MFTVIRVGRQRVKPDLSRIPLNHRDHHQPTLDESYSLQCSSYSTYRPNVRLGYILSGLRVGYIMYVYRFICCMCMPTYCTCRPNVRVGLYNTCMPVYIVDV